VRREKTGGRGMKKKYRRENTGFRIQNTEDRI